MTLTNQVVSISGGARFPSCPSNFETAGNHIAGAIYDSQKGRIPSCIRKGDSFENDGSDCHRRTTHSSSHGAVTLQLRKNRL